LKKANLKRIDLRKDLKYLYSPTPKEVEIVDVPEMRFVMIDGKGDPNQASFQEAVGTLYNVAYTLKFKLRNERSIDYPVMALEGLWWTDEKSGFDIERRGSWQWTLMISQPDIVTNSVFKSGIDQISKKKGPGALARVRLAEFHEGSSAQILHIGPYSTEKSTILKVREYLRTQGCIPRGKHHEIYLGDPRRADPAKLRTILRQPFLRRV
jgi:hypothetical protein